MSVPPPEGEQGASRSVNDEDTLAAPGTGWRQHHPQAHPPGPPPPGWAPPPPAAPATPAGHNQGRWWLIGTAMVAVAVVAAAAGWFAGNRGGSGSSTTASSSAAPSASGAPAPSRATAAPPPTTRRAEPNVSPEALAGLLLDPQALGSLIGSDGLQVNKDTGDLSSGTAAPPECLGAIAPLEQPVYEGSGFVAAKLQQLREPGNQFQNDAAQAVISFDSPASARALVDAESGRWSQCANRSVTATLSGGPTQHWQVEAPSNTGGVVSVATTVPISGIGDWSCQRGLTAQRNVVIEVRLCSATGSQKAPDLAHRIAERVTKVGK